jgi:heme/copper-type cytochrome/quinol oxidase subunit 2
MNLKVHSVYAGLPKDVREAIIAANRRPTVWDEHWKMFIVVAIVVAIAFVTLIICLLCFYCCQSKPDESHAKVEVSIIFIKYLNVAVQKISSPKSKYDELRLSSSITAKTPVCVTAKLTRAGCAPPFSISPRIERY